MGALPFYPLLNSQRNIVAVGFLSFGFYKSIRQSVASSRFPWCVCVCVCI